MLRNLKIGVVMCSAEINNYFVDLCDMRGVKGKQVGVFKVRVFNAQNRQAPLPINHVYFNNFTQAHVYYDSTVEFFTKGGRQ